MKVLFWIVAFSLLSFQGVWTQEYSLNAESVSDKERTDTQFADSAKEKIKLPSFEFNAYIKPDVSKISDADAGKHALGLKVAKFKYLFNDTYVTTTEVGPGNPSARSIINKPVIYNAVVKLERHYKKMVKKNQLAMDKASNEMLKVYNIANIAFSETTDEFEKSIKASKSPVDLIATFNRVKINYF